MLVNRRLPPFFVADLRFLASPEDLWEDRPLYSSCTVS
jgi:hypothetical protein